MADTNETVEISAKDTSQKIAVADQEPKVKNGETSPGAEGGKKVGTEDNAAEGSAEESKSSEMTKTEAGSKDRPKSTDPKTVAVPAVLKVSPESEVKSEELSTLTSESTSKSSESASSKVKKGVGALVQKFKSLGSPKKKTGEDVKVADSDSSQLKLEVPKMMELSPGAGSSTDGNISPLMASHEDDGQRPPAEGLMQQAELPQKTSPLKNILDKCKDLMGSPKKGESQASPQTLTDESCAEFHPTSLSFASSDVCSKHLPVTSLLDKTRDYFKRKMSLKTEQPESCSSSDSGGTEPRQQLDTPSSGVLGDISGSSTTVTESSSETSADSMFDESKTRIMSRRDTVIEVPQRQPKQSPELEDIESEQSDEVPLLQKSSTSQTDATPTDSTTESPRQRSPLTRQKKMQSFDFPEAIPELEFVGKESERSKEQGEDSVYASEVSDSKPEEDEPDEEKKSPAKDP